MLLQAIPAGATVLEAGCGRTTRLAEHRDRIRRLVGIDEREAVGLRVAAQNPRLALRDGFELWQKFVLHKSRNGG